MRTGAAKDRPHEASGRPLETEPEGVSALAARILNQLSLSSWLPGATLVAGFTVLLRFRGHRALSLAGDAEAIAANWIPVVILALPCLVLTTLFTQAFSFEAIRALEGYWFAGGPVRGFRAVMTRLQLRRKRRAQRLSRRLTQAAFNEVRPRLLRIRSADVVLAAEAFANNSPAPAGVSADAQEIARSLEWQRLCDPWVVARIEGATKRVNDYPPDHRVLPTRLGNILRATEAGLRADGDVETFALRRYATASPAIVLQHDQFRTRLDMYATLVFVALVLALASLALLAGQLRWWEVAACVAVSLALTWASYRAAIASARGYAAALRAMNS